MMMKPAPVAALEMAQAELLLPFFFITLNAPAQFAVASSWRRETEAGKFESQYSVGPFSFFAHTPIVAGARNETARSCQASMRDV